MFTAPAAFATKSYLLQALTFPRPANRGDCDMICDPGFLPLLSDYSLHALQRSEGSIFGLSPDLVLSYVNPAWNRFAEENGGNPAIAANWGLGASILNAIAPSLRPFFTQHYDRCLADRVPWEHSYECSSPERYRRFLMQVFPLGASEGLLVVNSLRVERSHDRHAYPPDLDLYKNQHGVVIQCSHCRRTQRRNQRAWDWVREWVSKSPAETSHGLCEACLGYYYLDAGAPWEHFPEPVRTIEREETGD